MTNDTIASTIEGLVTRVGSYGFCLDGREGWVSLSKFADPKPDLPAEGDYVTVGLDKSGYARRIMRAAAAEPPARRPTPKQSYDNQAAPLPPEPPGPAESHPRPGGRAGSRDARHTRLAVLNTAVALLGSGGAIVDLDQAMLYAEQLEAWVLR